MSNPVVTATITADDKASPVLRALRDLAKSVQDTTGKGLPGGRDTFSPSLRTAETLAKEHITTLERLHGLHKMIAGTVTGYIGLKLTEEAKRLLEKYAPYEKDVRAQKKARGPETQSDRLRLQTRRHFEGSRCNDQAWPS